MTDDTWLKTSIMAKRGVAKGQAGKRRALSIAAQGDGELSGVAIEQRATVTMQIDVIKGWSFAWPRLETENFLMTIGSARPLEDAARIAYRELVRWMSADYGFDEIDAYMLLSQAGRIRLGNMVDPKYTMGASILKKYLVA